MARRDRDDLQRDRVQGTVNQIVDRGRGNLASIFLSETVQESIAAPKSLIPSLDKEKILLSIPYNDYTYVRICPYCVTADNFDEFKEFVSCGAIIPVLTSSYNAYDEGISDFVYSHDHVSCYEFSAYRSLRVRSIAEGGLCQHCVGRWEAGTKRYIKRNEELRAYSDDLPVVLSNLFPFVRPDFELLDDFKSALKDRDGGKLSDIVEMSWFINSARSAQAFFAPISIAPSELRQYAVLSDVQPDVDVENAISLDDRVAKGLGVQIPTNVNISEYVDLSASIRPRLKSALQRSMAGKSESEAISEMMRINAEILRVKRSGRNVLLEAAIEFYDRNSAVLNATFAAGAFGLIGGAAGCIGGPPAAGAVGAVVSGSATIAKRKNVLKTGPAMERLSQEITVRLQPAIDRILSLYLGASLPAVSVMSLRRQLDKRADVVSAKPAGKTKKRAS